MAAKKIPGYKKIGEYRTEDLYEYMKDDGKKPRFIAVAARGIGTLGGIRVSDNNSVVDLRIRCREMDLGTFGPGYLTGYPYRAEKPEKTYQGVKIGRYTERDAATHLPKYGCRIDTGVAADMQIFEGDTVREVERKIRAYKKANPKRNP